jgi:conjugal transfer pilus assembly protein TraF
MDRASKFTEIFQKVVASTPYLDANTERPLDSVGANAMSEIASSASETLLTKLARTVGLVFFFRSDCAICATQVAILAEAQHAYGFTVLYVSLDGRPMPGTQLPAWAPNAGQAERFGVTSAPALGVMHPPEQVALLAKSILSLPSIGERLLLQARATGWISEDEYAQTRPLRSQQLLEASSGLDEAMVADAARFLAFIHAQKGAQP